MSFHLPHSIQIVIFVQARIKKCDYWLRVKLVEEFELLIILWGLWILCVQQCLWYFQCFTVYQYNWEELSPSEFRDLAIFVITLSNWNHWKPSACYIPYIWTKNLNTIQFRKTYRCMAIRSCLSRCAMALRDESILNRASECYILYVIWNAIRRRIQKCLDFWRGTPNTIFFWPI